VARGVLREPGAVGARRRGAVWVWRSRRRRRSRSRRECRRRLQAGARWPGRGRGHHTRTGRPDPRRRPARPLLARRQAWAAHRKDGALWVTIDATDFGPFADTDVATTSPFRAGGPTLFRAKLAAEYAVVANGAAHGPFDEVWPPGRAAPTGARSSSRPVSTTCSSTAPRPGGLTRSPATTGSNRPSTSTTRPSSTYRCSCGVGGGSPTPDAATGRTSSPGRGGGAVHPRRAPAVQDGPAPPTRRSCPAPFAPPAPGSASA
jgi:hypothetical protein